MSVYEVPPEIAEMRQKEKDERLIAATKQASAASAAALASLGSHVTRCVMR